MLPQIRSCWWILCILKLKAVYFGNCFYGTIYKQDLIELIKVLVISTVGRTTL